MERVISDLDTCDACRAYWDIVRRYFIEEDKTDTCGDLPEPQPCEVCGPRFLLKRDIRRFYDEVAQHTIENYGGCVEVDRDTYKDVALAHWESVCQE